MKRDNFKCCMCGRSPSTTIGLELHIDHIIPWSMGGETVIDNLQTLCSDCNLGKSNLSEIEQVKSDCQPLLQQRSCLEVLCSDSPCCSM